MRIVEIREKTASIASAITNAYIDFSRMTCSVVALITDVVRDGKPVVGYGFNSNGRYGQGALMRERFFPRLMAADPKTLVDEVGENLDPFRIWTTLMKNEKPGGHGERSVAVGAIDMAVCFCQRQHAADHSDFGAVRAGFGAASRPGKSDRGGD